jgi:phage baseplate assembly protein W
MARSVREIDRNEDKYVGVGFPLDYTLSEGFFRKTTKILEQSKHNLRNLLLTTPGERVFQPEFGSQLKYIVFEQGDDLSNRVEEAIRSAVDRFLPYININNIFTNQLDNEVNVSIEYSVPLNPEDIETLEFDFRIGE